jgi:hypothetical protein
MEHAMADQNLSARPTSIKLTAEEMKAHVMNVDASLKMLDLSAADRAGILAYVLLETLKDSSIPPDDVLHFILTTMEWLKPVLEMAVERKKLSA